MGSLPYVSLPRDDTKGGASPPLDTPACLLLTLLSFGNSRGGISKYLGNKTTR